MVDETAAVDFKLAIDDHRHSWQISALPTSSEPAPRTLRLLIYDGSERMAALVLKMPSALSAVSWKARHRH